MKKYIIILFLISISAFYIYSQDTDKEKPWDFELSYIGDNAFNLSGGIKTGYNYLGFVTMNTSFDTEKAKWWKGGNFFINIANTHGSTPSETLFGDIQTASNIEAGNHTFLQELWYKQQFNNVEFTLGLQDLNVELANTEYGGTFLNSSFGVLPTISLNLQAPIFPLTSFGITSKWEITKNVTWINALYDGTPTDFEKNPYNLKWKFNTGDGILFVSEFQKKNKINHLSGTYKLGIYTHNHLIERSLNITLADSINTNTLGVYSIFDQELWECGNKNIGAFLQAGYCPSQTIINDFYAGLGLTITGFFSGKQDDILGFALAYAHLKNKTESETALEFTWQKPFGKYIFVQPDIQYIIHPSRQNTHLKNTLAAFFRFGFNF